MTFRERKHHTVDPVFFMLSLLIVNVKSSIGRSYKFIILRISPVMYWTLIFGSSG